MRQGWLQWRFQACLLLALVYTSAATRLAAQSLGSEESTIDAREAERLPGTAGDPLAALRNLNGVARTNASAYRGGLVIYGMDPDDSQITVNGMDYPMLFHFGAARSTVVSAMIENIDVGAERSARVGRATGSTFDINLREPSASAGMVDLNTFDAGLLLERRLSDRVSVAVAGRRSSLDLLADTALAPDENPLRGSHYHDGLVAVGVRASPSQRVRAFFGFSSDQLRGRFDSGLPQRVNVGFDRTFHHALLEHHYQPNREVDSHLQVALSRDVVSLGVDEVFNLESDRTQVQIRETVSTRLSSSTRLIGGLDSLFRSTSVDARLPRLPKEGDQDPRLDLGNVQTSKVYKSTNSPGAFTEIEASVWSGAWVLVGMRFEWFGRSEQLALSPRLVARQRLGPNWALNVALGLHQQDPTFDETEFASSNPYLVPEKAVHAAGDVEFRSGDSWCVQLGGFGRTLFDLVGRSNDGTRNDGAVTALDFSNQARGLVYGAQGRAAIGQAGPFFGQLAYTWSHSERRDPDGRRRLFDFDQTHVLSLLGGVRMSGGWELSGRFRLTTGNPTAPDSSDSTERPWDEPRREDTFHQLDLRVNKRWRFETWRLVTHLDVQNVYRPVEKGSFGDGYDFTQPHRQQLLPLLPMFGVRAEF